MAFCRVCEIIGQLKFFVGFNRQKFINISNENYNQRNYIYNQRKYQPTRMITDKVDAGGTKIRCRYPL